MNLSVKENRKVKRLKWARRTTKNKRQKITGKKNIYKNDQNDAKRNWSTTKRINGQ